MLTSEIAANGIEPSSPESVTIPLDQLPKISLGYQTKDSRRTLFAKLNATSLESPVMHSELKSSAELLHTEESSQLGKNAVLDKQTEGPKPLQTSEPTNSAIFVQSREVDSTCENIDAQGIRLRPLILYSSES